MKNPAILLLPLLLPCHASAAEPFFKKNDVIALVGGEDMVVASEYGYLETLLTRASLFTPVDLRHLGRLRGSSEL